MKLETKLAQKLEEYELARKTLTAFVDKHAELLDKHEAHKAAAAAIHEEMKALFADQLEGPPEGVEKTSVWAKTSGWIAEVQFRQKSDSYDPTSLPNKVLTSPGVVTAVSSEEVAKLAGKYDVSKALVPGGWQKPVVLVKPRP